jgi:selenocysteine-specific elongation factor
MRHVVIGTAGHIDHGKTALVRALTGVDTDRLPEEKRRGITIELGFAPWPLAPEVHASIVDVPGHERLVHTMVAGATGVDLALLCIAADDGVMPQTREHLDVLALLGVARGLLVLTKCDLADSDVLALVETDIRDTVQGTLFADAPLLRTSSRAGTGLDELRQAVLAATRNLPERDASGPAFLPLDRVFQKHGFGTVVTGTLARGSLSVGDAISAWGERGEPVAGLKVRGLQSSNQAQERVSAGMRTAVNVAGRDVEALTRGMVLTNSPHGPLSDACVASVRVLGHAAPLRDEELTVHLGTSERLARILPLGAPEIVAGTTGPVLVRLGAPVAAHAGQRLILRRPGLDRGATVAGGEVLDPRPPRSKGAPRLLASLAGELAKGGGAGIEALALAARGDGLDEAALTWRLQPGERRKTVDKLVNEGRLVAVGDRLVHRKVVSEACAAVLALVTEHAGASELAAGLSEAELTTRVPPPLRGVVPAALARERERGRLVVKDGLVDLPGRGRSGTEAVAPEATRLLALYKEGRFTPPSDDDAATATGIEPRRLQDVLASLRREGRLVKVTTGLHYDAAALDEITSRVLGLLAELTEVDTGQFKELLGGVSRKYAIPLLEYLDAHHVTVRVGDSRKMHPSRRKGA